MSVLLAMLVLISCAGKTPEQKLSEKTGVRCIVTSIEWDSVLPEIIISGKVQRVGRVIPHIRGIETIHIDFYDAQGKRTHTTSDTIFTPSNLIEKPTSEFQFGISAKVPKGAKFVSIELDTSGVKTPRMVLPKNKR